jgi:hypothetical protein
MKFLKLALTVAMLGIAAAPYTNAQVVNQSTSVSKTKISSSVEKKAEPQYYELRCRGGVTYQSDNTYHFPVATKLEFFITEGRTNPATNERMMRMLVSFVPGAERVGTTAVSLQEGQCSWLDRGFRPDEPTQIVQEIVYFGQLKQLQARTPIDGSPTAAERYPDSKNVPEYLKDPNHYWSFFVRAVDPSKGLISGYFEATSSHYWKPLNINQEIRTPRSKVPEVKKPIP